MTSDDTKKLLAINGGEKVREEPWPKRALFGEEEKNAVMTLFDKEIIADGNFWYDGEEEAGYCEEFAEFLGGGYVDAVNSGTTAIYIALRALEIEPFTEVIVPPITDAGGVMPVPLINCIPVPADSAPGKFNVGPEQIEARINERTSAIIIAHIAGMPVDMDPIMEIARKKGIPVIEDCAQAHGAKYKGRIVGTIGDIAAISTMSGKHHATGPQGGVVFTKNEELYLKSRRYSDRGKPLGKPYGPTDWHEPASNLYCSMNFNNNDLAGCIGRIQLKKLPSIIENRRKFALALAERCKSIECISLDTGLPDTEGVFWFLVFDLNLDKITVDKKTFVAALAAEGLPAKADYFNLFTRAPWYKKHEVFGTSGYPWTCPLYKGDPDQEYPVPNAYEANKSLFIMGMHEKCGNKEIQDTVEALKKIQAAYQK
jgi:perosamine synthetase